jgi:hypothetical protein
MNDPKTECYKVWPTQRDREQFRDVLDAGSKKALEQKHPLRRLPRRKKYEPRPRMVEAYIFFYRQIEEFFLGTADEKPLANEHPLEERLDEALHALKAALQVVVIDLGHGDDAQVIFETLNARGEPSLPADLLRNYIFQRAARFGEPQELLYEQHWKPFDESFWRQHVRQGRLIRPRSDLFMQHYLASRQFHDVPVSHLFVEYKHWIDSKKPFSTVTSELEALAEARENYRAFIAAPSNTLLGAFAHFLETFDVGTINPLMLIIAEAKPTEAEWRSILTSLESYILGRTVCGLPTKAYNRVFLTLASNVAKDGVSGVALRERMSVLSGESSVWPSDAAFSEAFKTRAGYTALTQARVVYVLRRIFEALYSSKAEVVTINAGLTVEHLMPQKWQDHWPLQSGAKGLTQLDRWLADEERPEVAASAARDAIVQRIGNLTLLTQQLNSSVSNGPWLEKRQQIANYSILPLNQMAAAVDTWDEDSIAHRAEVLLSAAFKIWPGPLATPK